MKEKIGQFFAKLKRKPSNPVKTPNNNNKKENNKKENKIKPWVVIVVILALAIGGIAVYLNQGSSDSLANSDLPQEVKQVMEPDEKVVNVLPETERLIKSTDKGYLENPFEAPMVLVGVLQTRSSDNVATVRSGNIVYNVKEGDLIAGIWKVEEIHLDRIYLSSADREIMLRMEQ